jgi:glutathione S-transferase
MPGMYVPLTLVIGNKNYSSWSMRPWVLLRGRGIAFREQMLKFESPAWHDNIARLSPSGLVPVLWEGEPGSGFATWDTLAIAERLHELRPDSAIWPAHALQRARARAAAAEMHSGFRALRAAMPMNIRSRYPGKGMNDEVAKDIARISALWASARPYLFGDFAQRTPSMRRWQRAWSPTASSRGRGPRLPAAPAGAGGRLSADALETEPCHRRALRHAPN